MKKHANTLYITNPDAYVHKEGMTFVVVLDKKKVLQAPVQTIQNIVLFGYQPVSPALMAYCTENNIAISYLSFHGKYQASVVGRQHGNVLLRKKQYKMSDSEEDSLSVARHIVAAKIKNSRYVLMRHLRNHPECDENNKISKAAAHLKNAIRYIEKTDSLDILRGIEGECSSAYFSCFDAMISSKEQGLHFNGRSKYPPLDEVNALLSFVYTLITQI